MQHVVSIAGAILWGVLLEEMRTLCFEMNMFQSQGRFFGGCCGAARPTSGGPLSFNRRGDSLGGAAMWLKRSASFTHLFQSQGRFFGGCCGQPPSPKGG